MILNTIDKTAVSRHYIFATI